MSMEDEDMMQSENVLSLRYGDMCPKCGGDTLELEHHGMLECQGCTELFECTGEQLGMWELIS